MTMLDTSTILRGKPAEVPEVKRTFEPRGCRAGKAQERRSFARTQGYVRLHAEQLVTLE
jgi:hypothetical protein